MNKVPSPTCPVTSWKGKERARALRKIPSQQQGQGCPYPSTHPIPTFGRGPHPGPCKALRGRGFLALAFLTGSGQGASQLLSQRDGAPLPCFWLNGNHQKPCRKVMIGSARVRPIPNQTLSLLGALPTWVLKSGPVLVQHLTSTGPGHSLQLFTDPHTTPATRWNNRAYTKKTRTWLTILTNSAATKGQRFKKANWFGFRKVIEPVRSSIDVIQVQGQTSSSFI